MTSIFSDGALHPGRDANDAWWIVVRRAVDWGSDPRSGEHGTRFDDTRGVLELAPLPLAAARAAAPSAVAPDGTRYQLDPEHERILRILPCDAAPVPLLGVGGPGWQTGRFAELTAIAIDERGWIYVVERGNHRVQVIDPGEVGDPAGARVVIALGGADAWGRPMAGVGRGQLADPVAIAISPQRIYVATKGGWIQPFDRQFRPSDGFEVRRPGGGPADPVALASIEDDVIVAEAGWSRLSRFDCRGHFVAEIGIEEAPPELAATLARAQFVPEGTRVVGPIDGGIEGLAWHQIAVDAVLPDGTSLEIQSWAADAIAAPPPAMATLPTLPELRVPPQATPWAPEAPVAQPMPHEPRHGERMRPVLSDVSTWIRWRGGPYRRGVRWELEGTGPNASDTMTLTAAQVRRLRVGDQIELSQRALATVASTVTAISARAISVIGSGDRTPAYAAGTALVLRARGGRAIDGATLATLVGAEVIDLTAIGSDGGGADLLWPHRLTALLRRGDVIELRLGSRRAQLELEAIDAAPATITLAAAVAGDYRLASLRLVVPVDRMVCEHAEGWGDGFPPGSAVDVTIRSGDTETHEPRIVAWSDPEVATLWPTTPAPLDWIALAEANQPVATDRGRYLWIKLRLRGARRHAADHAATATPLVRSLRVIGPRLSYLSYLPAVFARRDRDTPSGALFLERFLTMVEGQLTGIEGKYESVARMLNPMAADDDWLAFVAGWFDLVLDPAWPRARRAALLAQIFSLYQLRGTREGLVRFVAAFTGNRPEVLEGFQLRPRSGIVLGRAGVLGCAPLGGLDVEAAAAETFLAAYAHRLIMVAYVDDDCDLESAEPALRALVDAIKPAHVDVELRIATPHGRIGLESTIGLDFVLGQDRLRPVPLGSAGPLRQPAPVLGLDAMIPSSPGGVALTEGGGVPVGRFTIR